MTPYLHSIHHDVNHLKYYNFGGIFSIYDRLLGTFKNDFNGNEFEYGLK